MAYTSRVPAVLRRMKVLLDAQTYPPHPSGPGEVLVVFGGLINEDAREVIVIEGTLADDSDINWASLGQVAHDERFAVRVRFGTYVPGLTGDEVLDRIEEVIDVIQIALRDQTTGQPDGGFGRSDDNDCQAVAWKVARVSTEFALAKEGVVGECPMDVAFFTRI